MQINSWVWSRLGCVGAAVLLGWAGGCLGSEPGTTATAEESPVADAGASNGEALLGTHAPAGTSFATTRVARIRLGDVTPTNMTDPVFLKLSLDAEGLRHVYLGRAPQVGAELALSLPTVSDALFYEFYDVEGRREAGELEVP